MMFYGIYITYSQFNFWSKAFAVLQSLIKRYLSSLLFMWKLSKIRHCRTVSGAIMRTFRQSARQLFIFALFNQI